MPHHHIKLHNPLFVNSNQGTLILLILYLFIFSKKAHLKGSLKNRAHCQKLLGGRGRWQTPPSSPLFAPCFGAHAPVVLSRTSVYFAISKLMLLFSYSFHVPCIILSNVLIDHNRKQVLLIKWVIFFSEAPKYFFALLNFLKVVIFTKLLWRSSTLWNSTLKITILF